jgi:hypothetical protein
MAATWYSIVDNELPHDAGRSVFPVADGFRQRPMQWAPSINPNRQGCPIR